MPADHLDAPTAVTRHPLLEVLTARGARADRLTHVRTFPARTGETADWPAWADPSVVAAYRALGVERPWVHQVEAADAAWHGRHVALATSTGSGKSLAFWLPALTAVRGDVAAGTLDPGRIESTTTRGSVLYLSPTKALAADQLAALERLLDAVPGSGGAAPSARGRVRVSTCDGDTPTEERRWVQEHADVVLTNPDFLHFSLLPNHRRWARFLRGLRYVVVDEGHAYRGVFGAHVSLVLRRLTRLAAHYRVSETQWAQAHQGSDIVFVVASATTAQPAASAARLLGVRPDDVTAVTRDTSPAGRRTVALWLPPEIGTYGFERTKASPDGPDHADDPWALPDPLDADHTERETEPVVTERAAAEHPRRSATAEAADLLADLAAAGARTLAFTRSRRGAESVAQQARDHLRPVSTELSRRVAAYRGGYLPEERRELEHALRTGALLGLATTNALELGVDISGLDAVLIAGWPGTRMSLWQQAGRAGRAGADGLVAFVAREDPLDTYLVTHPEAVFDAPLEATVFDPANPYVLAPQLCAAAQEVPLRAEDLPAFGDPERVREVLDVLVARGLLRRRPSGWYWTHAQPASGMADLRGSGGQPVRVVEATTGRLLGTVDAGSADGQVHDGAVYTHQGVTYVVDHLDLTDRVALVVRRDVDHGTWSREVMEIAIDEHAPEGSRPVVEREWGPVTWGLGPVEVTSQVVSFQRRRIPDMQVLGTEALDLPSRTLSTTAVWWSVPDFVLRAAGVSPEEAPGALHAAEHASIGLLPLLATCDRWDLGGVSTELHADTGQATVFVYDAYPGGAGFAERGFELGATWLSATRDAIAACPCSDGCPACVQSPKCGNYNSPLDKDAAVRLLDAVLSHAPQAHTIDG
ncbi:DEAD/DEAH box helicase [Isoptericola variabilis]|uniref:Helicase/secretion neighborhood putative DEAH-box helicase n=1 Tax=Isoptericola variabilis (strain 225) TaxID=743718 RepID=F6FTJ7_ISOV2|nr:DEAD/DEAH box helicase [Isoptericola variabilis]AEG43190.1 helicase/secretion neighborhood putative DEAH-box helicase [Isoptericola variabilis 225]TWH35124.1 DEAD/DEAH box helicase domain-containing protein [Isoptericola variabilis J7]